MKALHFRDFCREDRNKVNSGGNDSIKDTLLHIQLTVSKNFFKKTSLADSIMVCRKIWKMGGRIDET